MSNNVSEDATERMLMSLIGEEPDAAERILVSLIDEIQDIEQQLTAPLDPLDPLDLLGPDIEDEDTSILPTPVWFGDAPHSSVPTVHGTPQMDQVASVQSSPQGSASNAGHGADMGGVNTAHTAPFQQQPSSPPTHVQPPTTPFTHPSPPESPVVGQPAAPTVHIQPPTASHQQHTPKIHHRPRLPHKHHLKHFASHLLYTSTATKLLLISIASLTIVAGTVGAAVILKTAFGAKPSSALSLLPTLTLAKTVVSGGPIMLHGSHFAPGGVVTFTLDGVPYSGQGSSTANTYGDITSTTLLGAGTPSSKQSLPQDRAVVKGDGTFDKTIPNPSNWQPGSTHVIQAFERFRGTTARAQLSFTVQQPVVQCIHVTPQSLSFNSVEGQADPAPQTVRIINCGTSANWSGSVSANSGGGTSWLTVSATQGTINGGASQSITITASNEQAGLQPGVYSGSLKLTIGTSSATVNVIFALSTLPAPCLNISSRSLAFSMFYDQASPAPQYLSFSNCGATSYWTAVATTSDGHPWLAVSPSNSTLNGKATQTLAVTVYNLACGHDSCLAAGIYTGAITLRLGTSVLIVNVTLNQDYAPCIVSNVSSLAFQKGVKDIKIVQITNCGGDGILKGVAVANNNGTWLTVASGQVAQSRGTIERIPITVAPTKLPSGTYTGYIMFTIVTSTGSKSLTVSITLTVP